MSKQQGLKLNPAAVRERAKSVAGCKEVLAQGESVISFMVGLDKPGRDDALARINIFVDSGTIGTSRVMAGVLRQTFRRNVTSLDVVERLLKNPEKLLAIDDGLIGLHDDETREAQPKSIKKEIELADVGISILQGEREKIASHLESLQRNQSAKSVAGQSGDEGDHDDADAESSSSLSGMEFQFSLPADVMVQVDQCLKDISQMNKLVKVCQ
jgi:hypothetical protein